jgi:hypothetical protein
MKRLLEEAMATEFSDGWAEKCKIFLEKSSVARLEKSSQLDDFLMLDADFEVELLEMEPELPPVTELFVRFRADGLRNMNLSAWMRS